MRLEGPPWEAVRALGLPVGDPIIDYVVFGSAPLLAHGLLERVSDLDLLARGAAWDRARSLGEPQRAPQGDLLVRLPNGIEVFNGWLGLELDAIFARAALIDGLPIAHLDDVAHYKRLLGRPKDVAHLRLMGRLPN